MGGINYDANDRFCLDGERLIVVNGFANGASGAKYRTEHESFSCVKSFGACAGGPCNWTVEAKSGQIIEFGNTEDSRVQAATQPRGIVRSEIRMWALNKVSDRAGNYLSVTYYEDQFNGIHVPVWIAYSGNTNTGQVPYAAVQPVWQARPDIDTAYEAGSQIQTVHRLSHINTFTSPGAATFVKMYYLTYEAAVSPSTNRSRLQSVKECADAAGTNCLNPTNVFWQDGSSITSYMGQGLGRTHAYWNSVIESETYKGKSFTGDFNGDGKTDLMMIYRDPASAEVSIYHWNANQPIGDTVTGITNGLGAQTTITHKPLTNTSVYSKGVSAAPLYLDVQAPIYVVSNTSSSNGVGGTRDLRYFYYSAIARREGGGMMGFGAMQVYDDLASTIQTSWSRTDWPYQGFVYASQSQTFGGVLLSRTDSNLAAQNTYPGVYFSYPSSTAEQVYVANNGVTGATLVNTVTTTNEFSESPQYGNPKKITVTDTAGYTKTSVNNYDNDAVNWKLGRLTCAAVTNTMPSGATQTRTSGFSYNATGFLETETVEPGTTCLGALGAASTDANLRVTTTYSYDSYGNKQSATVSGGISATNSYVAPRTTYCYFEAQGNNPAGHFPTRVVNALGQTETHEFDTRFGAMTKLTGPNGVATSWAYDAFGRKASETRADGTSSTWSYAYYSSTWIIPVYRIITATTGAPSTDTYFDKLNRSVRSYVTHFDGVRSAGSGVDYDSLGRVAIRYRNFLSDATSYPATTPTYDILRRVTAETGPDGSTASFSYNGLTTTATRSTGRGAPATIASTTTVNTQGQKLCVTDAAGTVTSYTYDPFGNLLTTNAGGVITSMAYNLRGFKTSMNDPDMGVWSYQYSAMGELKQQTDAKLQVTTITYDILGRLTNRSEPSLNSNWYYDAYKGGGVCVGGKGKLCQVESNNGYNRAYTYDALGRGIEVAYTIDDLLNLFGIDSPPLAA